MRSTAAVKSASVTSCAWRRVAAMAASLTRLARSAPLKPAVMPPPRRASRRRPASPWPNAPEDLEPALAVGTIHQHLAVEAPGAQQRGVEDLRPVGGGRMIRPAEVSKPSISTSSWLSVCSFSSCPPRPGKAPRARPSASSSSMKMMPAPWRAPARRGRARAPRRRRRTSRRTRCPRSRRRARRPRRPPPGQQRLAGAGRADQQHALRDVRAEPAVLLRVLEEVDHFLQVFPWPRRRRPRRRSSRRCRSRRRPWRGSCRSP